MQPIKTLYLYATVRERGSLFDDYTQTRREIHGLEVLEGTTFSGDFIAAETGAGIVRSAMTATRLLERYRPESIVQFGIGGVYRSSQLSIGDLAVAESEVFADLGAESEKGFHSLSQMGFA